MKTPASAPDLVSATWMEIDRGCGLERLPFDASTLAGLDLTSLRPVRGLPKYEQMRHWITDEFSVTNGTHVACESLNERHVLLVPDADPTVRWIVEQPCKLIFDDGTYHIPDFLACHDHDSTLVDVKPLEKLADFADVADATAAASTVANVNYAVLTELPLQPRRNLELMRANALTEPDTELVEFVRTIAGSGMPFEELLAVVGADFGDELAYSTILGALFRGKLAVASLDVALEGATVFADRASSSRWTDIRHLQHRWSAARVQPCDPTPVALPAAAVLESDVPTREQNLVAAQAHILQLWENGGLPRPSKEWEIVSSLLWTAEMAATGNTDHEPPSRASVHRKRKDLRDAGVRALADGRSTQPTVNAAMRFPVFTDALTKCFLAQGSTRTGNVLIDQAIEDVRHQNERASQENPEAVPAGVPGRSERYAILKIVKERENQGRVVTAKSISAKQVSKKHRGVWDASRPGEVLMIDSSPANIATKTPEGQIGRDSRLILRDACTGMVVGLETGATVENASAVISLLLQTASDVGDDNSRHGRPVLSESNHSEIVNFCRDETGLHYAIDDNGDEFRVFPPVLPERIVIDGGAAVQSGTVAAACKQLGISIVHAPPRDGAAKPHVENFFRSLDVGFEQYASEYLGSNERQRSKIAWSASHRSSADLERLTVAWIVLEHNTAVATVYAKTGKPVEKIERHLLWRRLAKINPSRNWTVDQAGIIELLPETTKRVGSFGFTLNGLQYDQPKSDALDQLRGDKQKYPVKFFHGDVGLVWLRHPTAGWLELPWKHRHLLEDLPMPKRQAATLAAPIGRLEDSDPDKRVAAAKRFREELCNPNKSASVSRTAAHRRRAPTATVTPINPGRSPKSHVKAVFAAASDALPTEEAQHVS
jgi:hypothetical protein